MGRMLAAAILALLVAAGAAAAEIRYEPEIAGVEDDLAVLLQDASELFRLRDRPPASEPALRRRAEGDVERLIEALRSEGYFAGSVRAEIEPAESGATARLVVDPGPAYLLTAFDLALPKEAPDSARGIAAELTPGALEVELGRRARAEEILRASERAVARYGEAGHPFAKLASRRVVVDHAARTVSVELAVEPGPYATFGDARIEGLATVDPEVARRALGWREGEPFDAAKVAASRRALARTGLFSTITVDWPEAPEPDGRLPVRVKLAEGKHRVIGAGVSYSTSEGVGTKAYWGHDNLFGAGEAFRLEGVLAELRQGVTATLRKPWFLRPDQALRLNLGVQHEALEAYESDSARAGVTLERELSERLTASGGVAFEHSLIEEQGEAMVRDEFDLVDLPLTLAYDGADDLLNPRRGWRLDLAVTPTYGVFDTEATFFTIAPGGSAYFPLDADARHVLALRASAGTIKGESRRGIPASRRFYAGGGETVRGYGFQLVGPLDAGDQPIGGTSLLAGSVELRSMASESIGLVAFVDAGNVYEESLPDFDEGLRVGVGVGLRYYTPVGPLRLDLAFPLDKRDVDDSFQLYVSFGQAF